MGCLILLSGLPGSGKSTFAKNTEEWGKIIYFSSDEIRKELTGSYTDFTKESEVWKTLYNRAYIVLSTFPHMDVILDATFLTKKKRNSALQNFREVADAFGIVQFQHDLDIVLEQNLSREKIVPEKVIVDMARVFQPLDAEEVKNYAGVMIRRGDSVEVVKDGHFSLHLDWL